MSKRSLIIVALLISSSATASPKWTHLPDGRWMFVDPDKQMCDFEHHCYDGDAPPAPPVPKHIDPPVALKPAIPCPKEPDFDAEVPESFSIGIPHAMGTGCGNWPLGSDADLDCRRGLIHDK